VLRSDTRRFRFQFSVVTALHLEGVAGGSERRRKAAKGIISRYPLIFTVGIYAFSGIFSSEDLCAECFFADF
jgi:hypothetical protein